VESATYWVLLVAMGLVFARRCSNRQEVDSDNLNALLMLPCTRALLALVRQRVRSLILLSMIVLKFDGKGQRVNKKNGSGS
jgi:hypothetical protein